MRRFFPGFVFFGAIALVCGAANADLQSHGPWVEARAVGENSTSRAPSDGTVTVRPLLAAQHIQAASGELAIVNIDGYSFAKDLSTISFTDICIRNCRSTSASDVWVEVWASNQIPQIRGNTSHFTVASYAFGLVNGYATRCLNTGAIPMTPPNPGEYRTSIVVYEGSGSGRTRQFTYTDPVKGDLGGPFTESTIFFEKPVSHYVTGGGTTASIRVGRIRNTGSSSTRQLRLGLWASVEVPRYGQFVSAWTIASREYAPLNPGYQYSNVDTG